MLGFKLIDVDKGAPVDVLSQLRFDLVIGAPKCRVIPTEQPWSCFWSAALK